MTNQARIVKDFIDTLGNVKDWSFSHVVELDFPVGACVCGHPIKFEYYIANSKTGREVTVGSECIGHFKEYTPELYASLTSGKEKFETERKAKIKMEKDAPLILELADLSKEYLDLKTKLNDLYEKAGGKKGVKVQYELWYAVNMKNIQKVVTYKTLTGQKNYMIKQLASLKSLIENIDFDIEPYKMPEFDGVIWFGKHAGSLVEDLPDGYISWMVENFSAYNDDRKKALYSKIVDIAEEKGL